MWERAAARTDKDASKKREREAGPASRGLPLLRQPSSLSFFSRISESEGSSDTGGQRIPGELAGERESGERDRVNMCTFVRSPRSVFVPLCVGSTRESASVYPDLCAPWSTCGRDHVK